MASFLGTYKHSIDHKGRVSIPSRFRRALSGDAEETFVLLRGLDACVSLFPLDEWRRREESLRAKTFSDETNRRYQRTMLQHASYGALDAQGRVTIPPALLAIASLKKDAVVNGVLDHIEIWDPDLFERYLASSERTFEDMAGELLL
jgi:MraZ protein